MDLERKLEKDAEQERLDFAAEAAAEARYERDLAEREAALDQVLDAKENGAELDSSFDHLGDIRDGDA